MSDYYIEKDGIPVSVSENGFRFPSLDERRVASDHTEYAWISTIFLALDHGYGYGPPVLYETMVFPKENDRTCPTCGHEKSVDGDSERYCTREEALAGHARYVEKWSKPDAEGHG